MASNNDPARQISRADMGMGVESLDDQPKQTPREMASYYLDAVQSAEKRRKGFVTRGKQIVKRYKNKRTLTTLGVPLANRRMNILWSNVQTQIPMLYAQVPKANVSRRNKTKDDIGRWASIVVQNCLENSMGTEDFSYVLTQVVEDRLLPGSGLAMIEYVPELQDNPEDGAQEVGKQTAETRYLHWQDWVTNPARVWQEVWLFAYKVYLTRKECVDIVKRAGGDKALQEDVFKEITLDHREDGKNPDATTGSAGLTEIGPAKATVWCVWDKNTKQVIQVSPGYGEAPLAVMPAPVNFDAFFPCPRPLQSSTSTDSVLPVPDFEQYVDQADEIDLLTQRISVLSQALRLRGLYPADMDSLKQLTEAGDADMIPYDQWQLIMERGGADALVIWFPIEAIAKTLVACIQARDKAIEIMYQVTGISDIQRGSTDPNETAQAQQLKSQFGSIRVRQSQKEVQRFIRDLLRLKAEVICEHFSDDNIKAMSGAQLLTEQQKQMVQQAMAMWQQFGQAMQQYQQMAAQGAQQGQQPPPGAPMGPGAVPQSAAPALPPPPQQPPIPQPTEEMVEALKDPSWEQILGLLRNEKLRGFVIDVETDSTIEPDQQAQQQAAAAFVTAVAQFMTAALPIMQAEPSAVDFLGELMVWTARQWKAADTIEGEIDEFVEKMKKDIENRMSQPPPPNPEMIKAQAAQTTADAKAGHVQASVGIEQQKAEAELQAKAAQAQVDEKRAQAEMGLKQQEVDGKIQIEREKLAADAAQKEADRQHQMNLKLAELQHQADQAQLNRSHEAEQASSAHLYDTLKVPPEKAQPTYINGVPDAMSPLKEVAANFKDAVNALTKARTVVRGKDGKITGVK